MLGLISLDEISYVLNDRDDPNHLLSGEAKDLLRFIKSVQAFLCLIKMVKNLLAV